MMKKTVETKAVESTQAERSEIQIGERKYQIAPPSVSTIIEVSELIAKLPQVELDIQRGTVDSLMIARECKILGDIIAVMILGEGNYIEKKLFGLISINRRSELAKQALSMGPEKLNDTIVYLLSKMELNAFFAITSSLIDINLLRPTKQ